MRRTLAALLALAMLLSLAGVAFAEDEALAYEPRRIRTIITTDGEIDDQNSLVRYMLYANMFELEGLVSSSSVFHYTEQGPGRFKGRDSNQQWIDAYAQVYDNLCLHADGYPTPEYLTSINVEGNVTLPGEMDTDTDGSLLIKRCILDEREDLLFIQVWGGTNTLAAALRSIQQEYQDTAEWPEIKQKVLDKLMVWIDLDQDNTLNDYILPNWNGMRIIVSYDQFWAFGYFWRNLVPAEYHEYLSDGFMGKYIATDANPLSSIYYNNLGGDNGRPKNFMSEGDTPNYFFILDNGLRSFEDPVYGGWAGRFGKVSPGFQQPGLLVKDGLLGGLWNEVADDGDLYKPFYRWLDDLQNDFAARMEWCTKSYEEANHEPMVRVNEGIDISAPRGETVTLTAQTYDPDGDDVSVNFWQYYEADTYGGLVELIPGEGDQVSFTVPQNAKTGDTIHIIVEAQDSGDIPMTRYQRVIVTVVNAPAPAAAQ